MDLDADRKAFLDAGHALISEGLVAAHAVADANPRLPFKTLVMSIEGTMRSFFNHLMDVGKDAALAAEQTAEKDLGESATDSDELGGHPHDDNAADIAAKKELAAQQLAALELAAKAATSASSAPGLAGQKPLDPDTVGAPPVKDPTLKVQG